MMPINSNFSKYNLSNQSHKNTTLLSPNLGSSITTKFQINQPYHFQARREMKEKIVFLIRNVFTRKFHKIFNIEKKLHLISILLKQFLVICHYWIELSFLRKI